MTPLGGFFWGVFGGVLVELLAWYKDRSTPSQSLPWQKYWIATSLMILAGGGLVCMYMQSDVKLNAIICVNIGASAPLIIGALAGSAPRIPPGKID